MSFLWPCRRAKWSSNSNISYHIYEPRKDGTFLTIVSEDNLGGILEILKTTGDREIVGDGTATKALHILKTTNISGQEFFDLLGTEFSQLPVIEKAKFISILSLGSAGANMDAVAVVLNQVYNSYMNLSPSAIEKFIGNLAFLPGIMLGIAGKYGSKLAKNI